MDNNNFYNQDETRFSDEDYEKLKQDVQRKRRIRQQREKKKRARANAFSVLVGIVLIIAVAAVFHMSHKPGNNITTPVESDSDVKVTESDGTVTTVNKHAVPKHDVEVRDGVTYIDGILIVNKTYSIPESYNPNGIDPEAQKAFDKMAEDAYSQGIGLYICSGYRSYEEQETLYNNYASERGKEEADAVSARPGHSEHQTGLSMDVNTTEFSFENTPEAQWLKTHCADYGFIIRFPKGKEDITGFSYEPWHIRYVGVENAKAMYNSGLCLEEYLNITSKYSD
ncbi:MAG: D-alanyl-D-alanine carboxypeptidase family protein [Oscillospiraceae bacterium]